MFNFNVWQHSNKKTWYFRLGKLPEYRNSQSAWRGFSKIHLKASECWNPTKCFSTFRHNLMSFRKSYKSYAWKGGDFPFKKGTFSYNCACWGRGTVPQGRCQVVEMGGDTVGIEEVIFLWWYMWVRGFWGIPGHTPKTLLIPMFSTRY